VLLRSLGNWLGDIAPAHKDMDRDADSDAARKARLSDS